MSTAMRVAFTAALKSGRLQEPEISGFEKLAEFEFLVPRGLVLTRALAALTGANSVMKCHPKLTDANFANVDVSALVPGQVYRVRIYRASGHTTKDWIRFLRDRNAILAGPQALAALVLTSRSFQHFLAQKKMTVVSFAAKEELPKDPQNVRVVPMMNRREFDLAPFNCVWPHNYAILCIS